MAEPDNAPIGQNVNAARVHRWFAVAYSCFAVLAVAGFFADALQALLLGGAGNLAATFMAVVFWVAMALVNYRVAAGALLKQTWAQKASLAIAALWFLIGIFLFMNRPDMQAMVNRGDGGSAFIASLVGMVTVVHFIAAIYILLNSNWRQPTPPGEGPDSSCNP